MVNTARVYGAYVCTFPIYTTVQYITAMQQQINAVSMYHVQNTGKSVLLVVYYEP